MLTLADKKPDASAIEDDRQIDQIVISNRTVIGRVVGISVDLVGMVAMVTAAGQPPALSNATPLVTANQEIWAATSSVDAFASATAAHQFVRYHAGVAQASADAASPLSLAGV